jgi:2-dehydro-3-deoxyphosphogluconate aldolase/(4S)-4-hydroxy-2-oxoglutarate aldolase
MVSDDLIKAGEFDKITTLTKQAVALMLGFELRHVGINMSGESEADRVADQFGNAFGFTKNVGVSSIFSGTAIEVMKEPYLGKNGHIAMMTNYIDRAIFHLEQRGLTFNQDSKKYKNDKLVAIYLKDEFGGFAVHLLQK